MTDDEIQIYADDEAWWPPGQKVAREETVDVRCEACGVLWHVHRDLLGSRLKCRCEAWVLVPGPTPDSVASVEAAPLLGSSELLHGTTAGARAAVGGRPAVSASGEGGELAYGSARERARWTDRTLIELALLMVAFLAPGVLLALTATGDDRALFGPLAGLATSVLVFLISLWSHRFAFEGLRRASPRYFIEAFAATGAALVFAWFWTEFIASRGLFEEMEDPFRVLKDKIGLPMVIFMVGVVPGIFEEIAFRGLVQGRLTVLFGRSQAILVTGLAFALAHGGVTLAFPLHAGIGIYLCWLRARSGSLLPGMMLHFLYNTTLVVTGL